MGDAPKGEDARVGFWPEGRGADWMRREMGRWTLGVVGTATAD